MMFAGALLATGVIAEAASPTAENSTAARDSKAAGAKPAPVMEARAAATKPDAKSATSQSGKSTKSTAKSDKKADKKAAKSDTKTDKKSKAADHKANKKAEPKADKKAAPTKPDARQAKSGKSEVGHKSNPKPNRNAVLTKPHAPSAETPRGSAAGTLAPLSLRPVPAALSREAAPALPHATAAVPSSPLAYAPTGSTSSSDLSTVKDAIQAARRGRPGQATELQRSISDPLARKLVEWSLLRSDDNEADFARYAAFIEANPTWPSIGMLRRRAEAMLWTEKPDPATVRSFFGGSRPLSGKGRLALARALLASGDRAGAQAYVREAWRNDAFSRDVESDVLDTFDGMITRADDKARMDRRLYANDMDAAMRAAQRLGGHEPAVAKARDAVNDKAGNARALVEAVPSSADNDIGLTFSRIQWLRRHDNYREAARLMLAVPREIGSGHDTDEWWIERRLIARKLLDLGDAKSAYLIARNAATPSKENYKVEHEFTAGWIALRFLDDPGTAAQHFARIPATGVKNPISLARAGYWLGRAYEAAGHRQEARAYYEQAARYSTAYYGQLARARLGLGEIALRSPPALSQERRASLARLEVVRAVEILYALDEKDMVVPFVLDLADRTTDAAALTVLAETCARNGDARAVLLIGKTALGHGLPLDHAAFPTIGLPRFSNIGPDVEPAIVYAIARQESEFNPRTVSSANALGLMQVTPEAGRFIAKKYGVSFDQKRLLHDKVYNVQMGAAELGGNIEAYNGSYILAFAGYNAGRGRVKEWIERFGDPRDPQVDAVDWVERIPFSETRNYVQRIMENLQAYRVRFGGSSRLLIEADLKRGGQVN